MTKGLILNPERAVEVVIAVVGTVDDDTVDTIEVPGGC